MLILENPCLANILHPVVGLVFGRNDIPGEPKQAISRLHFEVMEVGADSVRIKHMGVAVGRIVTSNATEDVKKEQEISLQMEDRYFPLTVWGKFFFVLKRESREEIVEDSVAGGEETEPGIDTIKDAEASKTGDDMIKDAEASGDGVVNHDEMVEESSLDAYREWLELQEAKDATFVEVDEITGSEKSMLYEKAASISYLVFNRTGKGQEEDLTKVYPKIPMLEKMIKSRVSEALEALSTEHENVNKEFGFGKKSGFFSGTRIDNPVVPRPPPPSSHGKKSKRRITPTVKP